MKKDNYGRALYFDDCWKGYYIKVKGYRYIVAPVNKYSCYTDYAVVIREKSGIFWYSIYISNKHSNLVFEDEESTWNFINDEILSGKFDYYAEVENYNKQKLEEEHKRKQEEHNSNVAKAMELKVALEQHNIDINELVKLILLYNNVSYKYLVDILGLKEETYDE